MKTINKPKKSTKKTNTKDKNGFTLVELLAVIVVLAMLVLIAGRAVTGQITKAKRNTFRTETIEFAKGMIDNFDLKATEESNDKTIVPGYEYACSTLAILKSGGYIEYSASTAYSGYVEVFRQISSTDSVNEKKVRVNITNGTYTYSNKLLSAITADKVFDTQTILGTAIGACPASPTAP